MMKTKSKVTWLIALCLSGGAWADNVTYTFKGYSTSTKFGATASNPIDAGQVLSSNNHGDVVLQDAEGIFLVTHDGVKTAIVTPANKSTLEGGYISVNDNQQVAFSMYPKSYVWQNGELSALPDVPNRTVLSSIATDINAAGAVVGYTYSGYGGLGPRSYATLWADGQASPLTTGHLGSKAIAINDIGQVLGTVDDSTSSPLFPVIWADGKEYYIGLDDATNKMFGSTYLFDPLDINNNGDILVRTSRYSPLGERLAIFQAAVPEAGTLPMLLLGLAGLSGAVRARRVSDPMA